MHGLINPIFTEKKVHDPVYQKILKKEAFSQFMAMKTFLKFWFQQDGAKAHTTDLTLDLIEIHFKKSVGLNHFPLKKKETGAGCCIVPISVLWTISSGLCKGPVLRKQTDNDFGSAKNITDIFNSLQEDPGIFSLVTRKFQRRLEQVVEREGEHIENVII